MSRDEITKALVEELKRLTWLTDTPQPIAENLVPIVERLLADEREPMKCGHPRACLVSGLNKPIEPIELDSSTRCSACAERERVREVLNWALGELQGRGYSEATPKHACGYTGNPEGAYCEFCDMWVKAQELLDLTAPSSTEEKGNG